MSVRAYKINKIDYEDTESFNLWHDEALVTELSNDGYLDSLNEGSGIVEIPVKILSDILNEVIPSGVDMGKPFIDLDGYTREKLTADVAWAREHDEDYLQYYCF